MTKVSNSRWARVGKRLTDLVLSSVGLVAVSPVLVAAIVAVKVSDPGPVIFSQRRSGKGGKSFVPLKLRTMRAVRKSSDKELVPLDHPDVSNVGRVLRRFKIDELPQVANVVRGEMSLIGPRPTLFEQTERYDGFQRRRLEVRPGLTGLAQVNGNASISWDERIKYDVYYVENHNLAMDLGILLKTCLVVVNGEEAYARPFAESPYGREGKGG